MDVNALPVQIFTQPIHQRNLQVHIPVVWHMGNIAVERIINGTIQQLVYTLIKETGYTQIPATEVTGTYEIKTNERGVLSLSIIIYYFSGGAHGNTLQKSLTFDTQTGRVYTLAELFHPGAPYVQRLTEIVREQVRVRELPVFEPISDISRDQDFYIADKSLVLYYQLYEIVPYVYGFPYFPISVYDIQDIVDENGPLGIMIS